MAALWVRLLELQKTGERGPVETLEKENGLGRRRRVVTEGSHADAAPPSLLGPAAVKAANRLPGNS
jgi:hypothetical protein